MTKYWKMALLIMALVVGVNAGSRTGDVVGDFGGATSDTVQVDPSFSQGLQVGTKVILFLQSLDTILNQAYTESGSLDDFGANPLVATTATGTFQAFYLHYWQQATTIRPSANKQLIWNVDLPGHSLSNMRIAGINNFDYKSNPYANIYALAGETPNPVPVFNHFEARGSGWIAQWSNDTLKSGPAAYASWKDPSPVGGAFFHFMTWPSGAILKGPVFVPYNYLRVAFTALDDNMDDVVSIHGPSRTQTTLNNSTKVYVRWERTQATQIYAIDSQSVSSAGGVPSYIGLYHVGVAADSSKRVLAGWTNYTGQTLFLQAYSNNFNSGSTSKLGALTTFPVSLDTGITITDSLYRNFNIKSIQNNIFMVTYARGYAIYFRTVDISSGSPVISGETLVSLPGSRCRFPDLDVNEKYLAVSFFRDTVGGKKPEIVRFKRNGLLTSDSMVLSYPRITYTDAILRSGFPAAMGVSDAFRFAHVKHLALQGRVSVAIDTAGATVVGFNDERDARIVGFQNRKVYYDSASWRSKVFDLREPAVVIPLVSGDSVKFSSAILHGTSIANGMVDIYKNGGKISPPGSGVYEALGNFQYQINLTRVDSFVTPMIDSASLFWNLQPRRPSIINIRIGNSSSPLQSFSASTRYPVVNRRDSVWLYLAAYDLDNPASVGVHARTIRVSPRAGVAQTFDFTKDLLSLAKADEATYSGTLLIPPQNLVADTLQISLTADDGQWLSPAQNVLFQYLDLVPTDSMRILWKSGTGAALDSVATDGKKVRVQMNDSALVKLALNDANDSTVMVNWTIRGVTGSLRKDSILVHVPDTARIRIPWDLYDRDPSVVLGSDSLELVPDTLTLTVRDPDTTIIRSLVFIPNHWPKLDSVSAVGFFQGTTYLDTLVGRWRFGDSPKYLTVTPGVPVRMVYHGHDPDKNNGDSSSVLWEIMLQDPVNKALWAVDTSTIKDTVVYSFPANSGFQLAKVRIAQTDRTGAVSADTVNVVFPRVDTLGGWEVSTTYLVDSLRFVLGSKKVKATQQLGIRNIGMLDLNLLSVRTGKDDGAWLDYQILKTGQALVQDRTNESRLTTPLRVAANDQVPILFSVDVSAMTGDQVIRDTLYITTSDFLSPVIKVPFVVRWDDLPSVKLLSMPSILNSPASSLVPLTKFFPVNSSLVFVFSEPVSTANMTSSIKIYSRLDSATRGVAGITPIESAYPKVFEYRQVPRTGTQKNLVDTLIFTPLYRTQSDHFLTMPPPRYFLRSDQLGINISNAIVDKSGNQLDLRKDHLALIPGSLDTTFLVPTDTSTLRVLETWPKDLSLYDPDASIQILFSKPLVSKMILGADTVTALDLVTLDGDSNVSVQLRSRYSSRIRIDFRYLRLERGDSMLVVRPRYKFLSGDSVEVRIAPNLASSRGHTLDGDSNGLTNWPIVDTVDYYQFRFVVGQTDFYTFPNPFKASIAEHRQKGSITFKNLHQIKGVTLEKDIDIRIYTVDGNLVFSTVRKKNSYRYDINDDNTRPPLFEWFLCNNHGLSVASGVYMYTIGQGNKILKKSKLMVIR